VLQKTSQSQPSQTGERILNPTKLEGKPSFDNSA